MPTSSAVPFSFQHVKTVGMSFRAQLVFVLTVLLLLFAGAAGVATLATLDRALQEDGLRDVHGAADARRDAFASQLTLSRQRAHARLMCPLRSQLEA